MPTVGLKSKLRAAVDGRTLVRVTRVVEDGWVDGFIVGLGRQWMTMLVLGPGIDYAGFQVFRLRDVSSLKSPSPYYKFHLAVLRKRGVRRPPVPRLDLDSTRNLMLSAGKRFSLVTIHREVSDPGLCHIGRVISVAPRSMQLLEVSPEAEWDDAPTTYSLSQVTRIDLGGPYEEALALVAYDG
jgi:hypothetical protein